MSRPRLLLVPAFTALDWEIRAELEDWAETITFDPPGVGGEPLPSALDPVGGDPELDPTAVVSIWRDALVERALAEVDRRGWERFFVASDSQGVPSGIRLARKRPEAVAGIALGHAMLSNTREGERPTVSGEVLDAFTTLLQTDHEAFLRYGIAQLTRGSVDEDRAEQMVRRFPDAELIRVLWNGLMEEPAEIREDLEALQAAGIAILFAKHDGCLAHTDEGFEDIAAAFPDAKTVVCPEAPDASPAFAEALRTFCGA